jgi:hypothetical protein
MSEIRCDKHGMQARTLACQHIAYGLVHKERVGFFWTRDDFSAARPDAWCAACEDRRLACAGEWVGEASQTNDIVCCML